MRACLIKKRLLQVKEDDGRVCLNGKQLLRLELVGELMDASWG